VRENGAFKLVIPYPTFWDRLATLQGNGFRVANVTLYAKSTAVSADPNQAPMPVYEVVFDPHIALALTLLLVALIILFIMTTIPIPDERKPRRRSSKGDR
jgi:hypothetical protein